MSPRRPGIQQRQRVFIGCEGESERGYVAYLDRLLKAKDRPFHLDPRLLQPGSGDPLALVRKAAQELKKGLEHGPYCLRVILLDSDKRQESPQRDRDALMLAAKYDFFLLWQKPCHEASLLRHIDGCATLRPSSPADALKELCKRWPAYEKGMTGNQIEAFLGDQGLLRAVEVEPEFRDFLTGLGLT